MRRIPGCRACERFLKLGLMLTPSGALVHFRRALGSAALAAKLLPRIAARGHQPPVLDRISDGEVIQALKAVIGQPKNLVNRIVKKTANTCCSRTNRFGFEIQDLAERSGLPEQSTV